MVGSHFPPRGGRRLNWMGLSVWDGCENAPLPTGNPHFWFMAEPSMPFMPVRKESSKSFDQAGDRLSATGPA